MGYELEKHQIRTGGEIINNAISRIWGDRPARHIRSYKLEIESSIWALLSHIERIEEEEACLAKLEEGETSDTKGLSS